MPNRHAPAARCGRASASRISSNTGQEIASCGATLNRDACGSPWCRGRRRSAAQKSMRRATSVGAPARARGRRRRRSSAPMKVPSGLRLARPDMALVDMGVAVDEGRQDDAPGEVDGAAGAGCHAARGNADILPSATAMSASAKPSASKLRQARRQRRVHAGVGEHDSVAGRGSCVSGMSVTPSALPLQGALVPAPQHQMRISDSTRKITMPVSEIRISAANRRGALSR